MLLLAASHILVAALATTVTLYMTADLYGYSKLDHGTVDGHILVDENCLRFAASDGYLYTYGKKNALLMDRQWMGAPSFVAPVRFGGGIATVDLRGRVTVFPER